MNRDRKRHTRAAPLLLFAIFACTGEETLQFQGEPVLTAVAGTQGAATITLALTGVTDRAVRAIGWTERQDRPCELRVEFGPGLEARTTDAVFMNVCPGERHGHEDRMLVAESRMVPLPLFINEIQVAESKADSNHRMKGIRIWFASVAGIRSPRPDLECSETVTGGGGIQVGPEPTPGRCDEAWMYSKESSLNNAEEEFSPRASCPANAVATSVIVHVTATTDGEITGLQLGCQVAVIDRG